MDFMNPSHLLMYVGMPAVSGSVAIYFVGTYQPDRQAAARRFRPLTAAVYTGTTMLITKLALDGLCRASQQVSVKDVFDLFGSSTLFVALGAGIGAFAARHML